MSKIIDWAIGVLIGICLVSATAAVVYRAYFFVVHPDFTAHEFFQALSVPALLILFVLILRNIRTGPQSDVSPFMKGILVIASSTGFTGMHLVALILLLTSVAVAIYTRNELANKFATFIFGYFVGAKATKTQ